MSRSRKRFDAGVRNKRRLELFLQMAIERGDEEEARQLRLQIKHASKRL